jgi:hypothetical protein
MLKVAYASRVSTGPDFMMKLNTSGGSQHLRDLVHERLFKTHELPPAVAGDVGGVVRVNSRALTRGDETNVEDRWIEQRLAKASAVAQFSRDTLAAADPRSRGKASGRWCERRNWRA